MSDSFRQWLLRFNGAFLILAGVSAWITMDFPASFANAGPLAPLIAHETSLGIAFVEAHGLALIFGVLLASWRSETRAHVTAAAIHLLLGVSNLVFWNLFVATDTIPMGYVTTVVHGVLFVAQACAALVFRK